jgi:hypothetical protein
MWFIYPGPNLTFKSELGRIDTKFNYWRSGVAKTLQGKNFSWQLSDTPIGTGDAGEVFSAACHEQPELQGILKKPARVASLGTLQRQAGQIAQEAQALLILDGLPLGKAHPPRLIDTALDFTNGTANYFFVSETAAGEDMETLLAKTRQAGKPFPRRVIITVLDALFDLFSRAHKAGVLWNDVKLDHIYWHNPTNSVTVIDWGNAVFLEHDQKGLKRIQPRWEDYQQMVTTLGNFLQHNAPDLYNDLGWEEFKDKKLDAPTISILARRIAYQQETAALNIMEYQSLIKLILNNDPTLSSLETLGKYQNLLEHLGAPWDQEGVLAYGEKLVISQIKSANINVAVRASKIIWDMFQDSLDLSWHLIREFFHHLELINHPLLQPLVEHTFAEEWTEALWILAAVANYIGVQPWWKNIAPVMRQKALDSAVASPYQIAQAMTQWAARQTNLPDELVTMLESITANWRTCGQTDQNNPLEYELREIIRNKPDLPQRLRAEGKRSFAEGQTAIRDLFNAWMNADWDSLPNAIKPVLAWDPDRWGLIKIKSEIDQFIHWRKEVFSGPAEGDPLKDFLNKQFNQRPIIERYLGLPIWLRHILDAFDSINQDEPIANFQSIVSEWAPWLLNYSSLAQTSNKHFP